MNNRAIGFGKLFDLLSDLDETMLSNSNQSAYPPYNVIEYDENTYAIELAVAGFKSDDVTITQDGNKLVISGTKQKQADTPHKYLHHGISQRSFTRKFVLAEHVYVDSADFSDGIITVNMHRKLPESLKPRQIEIKRLGV